MILIDNNLSYRLKYAFKDFFKAKHLSDLKLERESDKVIWQYCKDNNLTIVTKDFDFIDIQNLDSFPPKIVLITLGNTTTHNISVYLKSKQTEIKEFLRQNEKGVYFL